MATEVDFANAVKAYADAKAARTPFTGRIAKPSGLIQWQPYATLNFNPRSVGVDGQLYFTYLNTLVMRSADPTLAVRTAGPDFTGKTPSAIRSATRTTAGYVVVTSDAAADTGGIWFCPNSAGFSTSFDDWVLVKTIKASTGISIARQRVIAGVSWLVVGEYVTGVFPSAQRDLWLSRDGGQTWVSIRKSVLNSDAANSHWHCAMILPSGRIWASNGDGVNSWMGYTDDAGQSWVAQPALPVGHPLATGNPQQPTVMLDLGDTIGVTPDAGAFPTGLWAVDPDTGETREWAALPSGEVAHTQYGSAHAQRGKEAYVLFPDQGSGSKKSYILGTGDAGRSWHVVSTIDTTGANLFSFVGLDANGRLYAQPSGSIPIYGTGIMVGTPPTWS